jgi:diguanylate cyclase (GGDEF)-like protein
MKPASVSSLNTYLTCPRRYYFAYVEWLPSDANDRRSGRFALSQLLHAALFDWHGSGGGDWSRLDAALADRWDRTLFPDSVASASAYHRARWILWERFELLAHRGPVRHAWSFDFDFAGGRFRGRIDRVDETAEGIEVIDYVTGDRRSTRDVWGLKVYGAVAARLLRRPIAALRLLRLGAEPAIETIEADAVEKVESDIRRLRRAIDAERVFPPRPDRHCAYCPYAPICDAVAKAPVVADSRHAPEMFRLFSAMETLSESGETVAAWRASAEKAATELDRKARLVWLDGVEPSEEVSRILVEAAETEGEILVGDGRAVLQPGSSLLVPILGHGIVVFTAEVTRNAAEILGRALRLSLNRLLDSFAASTDGLTGLKRREILMRRLAEARPGAYSLVICDLDHFKAINDTHGHDVGDIALRRAASILDHRPGSLAFRLGGEEFVLLVPAEDPAFARDAAEAVRREIEAAVIAHTGGELRLTASFGLASSRPGETGLDCLKRADEALYRAKNAGRNRVESAE